MVKENKKPSIKEYAVRNIGDTQVIDWAISFKYAASALTGEFSR